MKMRFSRFLESFESMRRRTLAVTESIVSVARSKYDQYGSKILHSFYMRVRCSPFIHKEYGAVDKGWNLVQHSAPAHGTKDDLHTIEKINRLAKIIMTHK